MDTLHLHGAKSITLGPVRHFPNDPGKCQEFWVRSLTVEREGNTFTLSIFNCEDPAKLMLPNEASV